MKHNEIVNAYLPTDSEKDNLTRRKHLSNWLALNLVRLQNSLCLHWVPTLPF